MSIRIQDKSPKTYVVLGCHHTGTSFISKMLEEAGVAMGSNKRPGKDRFYENYEFMDLNVEILKEAGGSGRHPPSEEAIMAVDADSRIKKLINKFKGKFWGWKDPRTSLTIKKYLPHLEGDVYLICMFRKQEHLLHRWKKTHKRDMKHVIDEYNKAILSAAKEFCDL